MNSKSVLRLFFHVLTTAMYFYGIVTYLYLPRMPHRKIEEQYAGSFKYLTYWNLIVQGVFFAFSCIIDLMKSSSTTKLTRFRDKFYAGIVLPYGVFVFAMFWGLYSVDRELIFPKSLDGIFPSWLNHVSHTVILPALLIETYIVRHRHPHRKEGITYASAFGLAYMIWILYLGFAKDIWVYPVLQIMNWIQRLIFFGLSIMAQFGVYVVGEKINAKMWGENIISKTK